MPRWVKASRNPSSRQSALSLRSGECHRVIHKKDMKRHTADMNRLSQQTRRTRENADMAVEAMRVGHPSMRAKSSQGTWLPVNSKAIWPIAYARMCIFQVSPKGAYTHTCTFHKHVFGVVLLRTMCCKLLFCVKADAFLVDHETIRARIHRPTPKAFCNIHIVAAIHPTLSRTSIHVLLCPHHALSPTLTHALCAAESR